MAEGIAAFVVAAMTAVLQVIRGRRGSRPERLTILADLYRKLPQTSTARATLLSLIDSGVEEMAEVESEHRRDSLGLAIAIGLMVVGALLTWVALRGGWWWLLLGPSSISLLLGIAGFGMSIPKRKRDAKGKVID